MFMFVPSLSWQIFGFEYENGAKKTVFHTAVLADGDEEVSGADRRLRKRRLPFLSMFPMFVPSLSW
jgi:hypothetical protein